MTHKTKAREIVEVLKSEEEIELLDVFYYGDNDKSVSFRILDEGGSFKFMVDGKGERITLYDQINSEYEYDDPNLVVAKIKEYISEHTPLRNKEGDFIREEGTSKKEALGKTATGCLQLLPVVVALGLLIAVARACG